ncbi:MAG: hypothetical protein Q9195_009092 [Heterodermia aff. obscurata]
MSFGWSVSDIALLVRLAYRTVEGARAACGEYDELTREVTGLHNVLNRLQKEARKPSSFLNRPGETYRQELEPLSSCCKHILTQLDTILVKYNALSERERSARKLWKQVRFGSGAVADVADLRSKIASCNASLSLFLNLVSLGTVGEVERKMNQAGGDLTNIKIAVNGIVARLSATAGREESVLTAYTNDDKDAWRELRRGLVKDGFRGSVVRKHMTTIMDYVKELGDRRVLDERGCEEDAYVPSKQDDVSQSHREYQPALATENPKTTGSSNQAQTMNPEDDSTSNSSVAPSDSSSSDDGATSRPLPLPGDLCVESACETAGEDGHVRLSGTPSSKDNYLHSSLTADGMTGQEPSDADPNIREFSLLDIGEELPQQEVADQRKYKQEYDGPGSAGAWTASNTNRAHLDSNAALETTGRMNESDRLWSDFVDPCWSTKIFLYQIPLENYRFPTFIALETKIRTPKEGFVYRDFQPCEILSAIIRFKVCALKVLRPNLMSRGTFLSQAEREQPKQPRAFQFYPGMIELSELRILNRSIHSCLDLLHRMGQCIKLCMSFTMEVTTDEVKTIQPEQINALCLAFTVELGHLRIPKLRNMFEHQWRLKFAAVAQEVEAWVRDFDLNCMPIMQRIENMPD